MQTGLRGRLTCVVAALVCAAANVPAQQSAPKAPQTPTLPRPTGAWNVATRVLTPVVDSSRPDDAFESGFRTIPVQLWYPTRATHGNHAPYVDEPTLEA